VREVDINYSNWDNLLEAIDADRSDGKKPGKYCAVRLGFRQVKGLREEDMQVLIAGRKNLYTSIPELVDAGISKAVLERLADADAFRSIGFDRRRALWEVAACHDQPVGLFTGQAAAHPKDEEVQLPEMKISEHVVHDYAATSLSLKAHPVKFVREKLEQLHILPTGRLTELKDGDPVKVAGLVLVRQRPGTASGICFITIEDETGVANLVVFANLFDEYRKEILQSRLLMVEGKLQREGEVIHVIVRSCYNLSSFLRQLTAAGDDNNSLLTLARADEKSSPVHPSYPGYVKKPKVEVKQESLFGKGRNFK